jgi:multidrug efflux system outer membrane protein
MTSLHRTAFLAGMLVATASLPACMDLAPAYQRPEPPLAAAWPPETPLSKAPAPDAADIGWRGFIQDNRLRETVALAMADSRDLRIALSRVDSARAQFRVRDAARGPSVEGVASLAHARSSGVSANSASLAVDLPAYEIDLFGRLKNASSAALQDYLATAEGARSARMAVVADVALAWLRLAADAQNQRLNEQTLAANEASLGLNQRMHALGAIGLLPVLQAQSARDATRGAVAAGRAALLQDRDALDLVVGRPVPEALLPLDAFPVTSAALMAVPAGLPARVLQQRPDVLASEHQLQAAQLEIGMARAAWFPTIALTGRAGTASASLAGLLHAGAGAWSFGPSISLPIFNGGALEAGVAQARSQRDIARATYEKTLQTAFSEVARALAVRLTLAQRQAAQQAQRQASEAALHLAEALYRQGAGAYLEVLDAQRTLYAAQQAGVALDLDEQQNRIALYKSLGGGWKDSN